MNRNVGLLIVGFIVGFIISFFYVNSQYESGSGKTQNTTTQEMPADHPSAESDKASSATATSTASASTASKTGVLQAFGANTTDNKAEKDIPAAETTYKNIQVLKGTPSNQVLTVMKAFTEGLGVNCVYCHVSTENLSSDDKPMKETARKMLVMVREMNKNYPTKGQVTCYTCHRGTAKPVS
jgi:cytoskeletal protein RodZ